MSLVLTPSTRSQRDRLLRLGGLFLLAALPVAAVLVAIIRDGVVYVPPHLSKDQDIEIHAGDVIAVSTPGGGGFGPAKARPAAAREPVAAARAAASWCWSGSRTPSRSPNATTGRWP